MNLGEFLSPEAGQRRTRALHEFLNEDVAHFVPPNLREPLGLLAQMNPVNDIYEAGGDLRDGDYIGAATNTAAAALPLAGAVAARPLASGLAQTGDDATRAIVDALTMYQAGGRQAAGDFIADESGALRLYHGSPHDFDRFSVDAIGTGEGAQAYGHGLYFAESEDVARQYRDALSRGTKEIMLDGKPAPAFENDRKSQMALHFLEKAGGNADAAKQYAKEQDWLNLIEDKIDAFAPRVSVDGSGHLYEVNVNANPEDFLDWDAPLSEQNEAAQSVFNDKVVSYYDPRYGDEELTAAQFFRQFETNGTDLEDEFRNAGVPGIKYRDAGSRGLDGAEGTRNYVVFDENLIEIVRKYGIAGAAAMLGMSASDVEAQIGQQDNMSGILGMPTESALRDYLNQ